MAWFSRTNISSLTGQLTSFARDVVTEEVEPTAVVKEEASELADACKRIEELERTASKLREETIRYQKVAKQNEQKARSYEQEIDRISNEHIEAIRDKEFAIKRLERQLEEIKSSSNFSVESNNDLHSGWSDEWQNDEELLGESQPLQVPQNDERLSDLEYENESLRKQLDTLEQFYQEKVRYLEIEAEANQTGNVETTEASIQFSNEDFQSCSEQPSESDSSASHIPDFDPSNHSSLEQYSCLVIQHKMPKLARALTEMSLENQDLKQTLNIPTSNGNVSLAELDVQSSHSGGSSGSSTVDSSGSWRLVSSGNRPTTAVNTPSTNDLSKPCSPVEPSQSMSQQTEILSFSTISTTTDAISPFTLDFFELNNVFSLISQEKLSSIDVSVEALQKQSEQLGTSNIVVLVDRVLSKRAQLDLEVERLNDELNASDAKLEELKSDSQDVEKLRADNERLQNRVRDLSIALETADQQLQRIEFGDDSAKSESSGDAKPSENLECPNCLEDLKQTQFLLDESLASNQKMSAVMEDQKQNLAELRDSYMEIVNENSSLRDLTQQLSEQIEQSEKVLEQLKQSQLDNLQKKDELTNEEYKTPEYQLRLVTDLQTEVNSLRKRLDQASQGKGREKASGRNTPVSFFVETPEKSVLEQALLDKEEIIVRLSRDIDNLKLKVSELNRQNDSRFETQSELVALKEKLISLQGLLVKQEDLLEDKDAEIETLQQSYSIQDSQKSDLQMQLDRMNAEKLTLISEKESLKLENEELRQKFDLLSCKFDALNTEIFSLAEQILEADNLESKKANDCTGLVRKVSVFVADLTQERDSLKKAVEEESDEKDQSIFKIAELSKSLKHVNKELETEKSSNAELREQCMEMMRKLECVTSETNDYGIRLKQVSEKLAASVHEKCDLNSKIVELLAEREELLQSIARLHAEKAELLKEIESLKKQLNDAKDVCEKLTTEIEFLVDVDGNESVKLHKTRETAILHDDLKAKTDGLNSEIENFKSKMLSLENELETSEKLKNQLSNELLSKENDLAKINCELKSLHAELETIFESHDCEEIAKIMSWMKSECIRLDKEISQSKREREVEIEKCSDLSETLKVKEREIRSRDLIEKKLERELEDVKVQLQNLQDKNEYLEDGCKRLAERNESLIGSVSQLEGYLQMSERRLEETISGDWENRYEKERQTVETQKSQLGELRSLVEGYEYQLKEAVEDYEMMKQRYSAVSERVSGNDAVFKEEIASLKEENNQVKQEKNRLKIELDDSASQIESLTRQMREMYSQIQNLKMKLAEKEDNLANVNEKLAKATEDLTEARSSLGRFETQFKTSSLESEKLSLDHSELSENVESLQKENEKLRTKSEALSEILNENEQGWNQKFKKQQEDFEQYAQQAYQVRVHYDQLLFAYNEKTQQNSDLEKTVDNLKEEIGKLEERLLDASSMATVTVSEEPVRLENAEKVTRSTPDLLQTSSNLESLQRANMEKDERISKMQSEVDGLREQIQSSNSGSESLSKRVIELEEMLNKKQDELKEMSSKKERLSAELVRLRDHMLKIEEGYTQEALAAEEREKQLRTKLYQTEDNLQRITSSSSVVDSEMLTKMGEQESKIREFTARTSQLELQLQEMTDQMDLYRDASQNLQLVLETFQKEQSRETEQLRETFEKKLSAAEEEKGQLEAKLRKLTHRLEKQNELLEQAAHLNSEMELREEEIERLRAEVDTQLNLVAQWKKKANEALGVGEKVDKQLVRNLLVAYLTVPANKKSDALNMIARFLEFSEEERNKVGINVQRGWFSGWIPTATAGPKSSQSSQQESFTKKFIEFLENESTQPSVLSLPHHHLNPPPSSGDFESSNPGSFQKQPSFERLKQSPSGGGFNPFSASVLPQMRTQSSPNTSLSRLSASSYEQEYRKPSASQHSRNSSISSSSAVPSTDTGAHSELLDDSDESSTVQVAESSFLKNLLREH